MTPRMRRSTTLSATQAITPSARSSTQPSTRLDWTKMQCTTVLWRASQGWLQDHIREVLQEELHNPGGTKWILHMLCTQILWYWDCNWLLPVRARIHEEVPCAPRADLSRLWLPQKVPCLPQGGVPAGSALHSVYCAVHILWAGSSEGPDKSAAGGVPRHPPHLL